MQSDRSYIAESVTRRIMPHKSCSKIKLGMLIGRFVVPTFEQKDELFVLGLVFSPGKFLLFNYYFSTEF